MQHHDAITATSYPNTLDNWKEMVLKVYEPVKQRILGMSSVKNSKLYDEKLEVKVCMGVDDMNCKLFDNDNSLQHPGVILLLYNPGDTRSEVIAVEVP